MNLSSFVEYNMRGHVMKIEHDDVKQLYHLRSFLFVFIFDGRFHLFLLFRIYSFAKSRDDKILKKLIMINDELVEKSWII